MIALVSIPGSAGAKGASLTRRDRVHKENPRQADLDQPVNSGVYDFHVGIVVLLNRISISHHQDNSARGSKCPRQPDALGQRAGKIRGVNFQPPRHGAA